MFILLSLFVVIITVAMFAYAGFKFTILNSAVVGAWALTANHFNPEGYLLFYIWVFFVALAIMDINNTNKGGYNELSKEDQQTYFSNLVAKYKHDIDNATDDSK